MSTSDFTEPQIGSKEEKVKKNLWIQNPRAQI